MKASIGEVKKKIGSYVHRPFPGRDFVNEQDLSAVRQVLSPYSNVRVSVDRTRYDDGCLDCVISVNALFSGGTLRYEIRSGGRKKKFYDPLSWIDEIEKWDILYSVGEILPECCSDGNNSLMER